MQGEYTRIIKTKEVIHSATSETIKSTRGRFLNLKNKGI